MEFLYSRLSAFRYFLGVLRELCGKITFFGGGVIPATGIFIKQLSRGLHKTHWMC
jgi:hypothetical protein